MYDLVALHITVVFHLCDMDGWKVADLTISSIQLLEASVLTYCHRLKTLGGQHISEVERSDVVIDVVFCLLQLSSNSTEVTMPRLAQ
jgi:hypothetical protein